MKKAARHLSLLAAIVFLYSGCGEEKPAPPADEAPAVEPAAAPAPEEPAAAAEPAVSGETAEPEEVPPPAAAEPTPEPAAGETAPEAGSAVPGEAARPEASPPPAAEADTPPPSPSVEAEAPGGEETAPPAAAGSARSAAKGDKVQVLYRGTLDDGTVFDASERHGNRPLEFVVGAGQMIPGFDKAVEGMKVGDKKTIRLEPKDAYGPYREGMLLTVPKTQFPPGTDLSPGSMIAGRTPQGIVRFVVKEDKGDSVVLDANHPLAGKTLNFELTLVGINPPPEPAAAPPAREETPVE